MTDSQISRVRYYDQQILRTSDFVDEQAYHLVQRRRHNIGGHIWGIVYGLELAQDSNGELGVQSGMAIDGYGRELILGHYQPIERHIFDDKGGETLDVYLEYAQQPATQSPPGYNACGDTQNAGNRVQEAVRLVIRKASGPPRLQPGIDLPERRQPEGVPPDDLRFSPDRAPPDDPQRRWPVFLGQLRRGVDPPVSLGGRPYAGLRGEILRAASDWAWLQVGEWPDNEYRFGVFLAEVDKDAEGAIPEAPPRGPSEPILGIKLPPVTGTGDAQPADANVASQPAGPMIELRANTTLSGDLFIEGGAIDFGAGPAYESAQPWRMYHVFKNNSLLESNNPDAVAQNELRIEMAAPDEQGTINEVVVGHWSAEENDFVPCLTVAADCDVTVHRNLVVNGDLLRFNKADATNEVLVRFVVSRTKSTPEKLVPDWFGTLLEELNKKSDLLRDVFLPFLVKKAQPLGQFGVLVAEMVKPDNSSAFLPALARQTQEDFASAFLRALAKLAEHDSELRKRLTDTLSDLTRTLTGPGFDTRFWPILSQRANADTAVRDALLNLIVKQAKTDTVVSKALVQSVIGQAKTDTAVRDELLNLIVEQAKTDATVSKALVEALVEQAKTDATVSKALVEALVEQAKTDATVSKALVEALVEQAKTDATVSKALVEAIVQQAKTDVAARDVLVDELADKAVALIILQPLMLKISEKQADDTKQRAAFFATTLLGDLVEQVQNDADLRAALVAAIKARPGLAETLCAELGLPARPPVPAGADLQRFINQLDTDEQFRANFAKKTKNDIIAALREFAQA